MAEVGIDLSREEPRRLTEEMALEASVVVTMGCGDACPVFPGKRYVDWDLEDPAGKDLDVVRQIRDDIERRVQSLIDEFVSGFRETSREGCSPALWPTP
jgi:protein-tyrosine-phosphatase